MAFTLNKQVLAGHPDPSNPISTSLLAAYQGPAHSPDLASSPGRSPELMIDGTWRINVPAALTLNRTTMRQELLCCFPEVPSWTDLSCFLSPAHWCSLQASFPPCIRSPPPMGASGNCPLNTLCALKYSSQDWLGGWGGNPKLKHEGQLLVQG